MRDAETSLNSLPPCHRRLHFSLAQMDFVAISQGMFSTSFEFLKTAGLSAAAIDSSPIARKVNGFSLGKADVGVFVDARFASKIDSTSMLRSYGESDRRFVAAL